MRWFAILGLAIVLLVGARACATSDARGTALKGARFSPDGMLIATASVDGTARIWDVTDGHVLHVLKHPGSVMSANFDADGTKLVTSGDDGRARIWDTESGRLVRTLHHPGDERSPAGIHSDDRSALFSPNGRFVLKMGWVGRGLVWIWDADTGRLVHTLKGHRAPLTSAEFSRNGKRLVTASEDATARAWDVVSGRLLHRLPGHTGWVYRAVFSPDGARIVTCGDSASRIWDASSGRLLHTLRGHNGTVYRALFSPDGTWVVTGGDDDTVRIWRVADGRLLHTLRHDKFELWAVESLDISPGGNLIASSLADARLWIWDAASGRLLRTLEHTDSGGMVNVREAHFSPAGTRLLTATITFEHLGTPEEDPAQGKAWVWEASSGRLLQTLSHR